MFVAHGPFAAVVKAVEADRANASAAISGTLPRPNKGWHSTADDTYVMETFENVQVYNLMMKLLGIEDHSAPNNGTKGFWDQYF